MTTENRQQFQAPALERSSPRPINIWLESLTSSKRDERNRRGDSRVCEQKDEAILALLAKMALHYWRPDFTPSQAKQLYGDYVDDLSQYPMSKVAAAIEEYRQRGGKFFPTVQQLISLILGEARLEAENPGAPDRARTLQRIKTELRQEAQWEINRMAERIAAQRPAQLLEHEAAQ